MHLSRFIINKIKQTPLNDLVKGGDNREIVKGAGTTFILKVIGIIFSYGFNIYFARIYGAEVIGIYALTVTVGSIFIMLAKMGTDTSLVRFVAQYAGQEDYSAVKKIYKMTLQWIFPLSIFFAFLLFFSSSFIAKNIFNKPLLIVPLKITAFSLPLATLLGVNRASLRGLKKIKDAFIFSTVLPPVLNTVGLMTLTYFVFENYLTPIYVNLITVFIGAFYSFFLWEKQSAKLPNNKNKYCNIIDKKEIIKVSLPMFMTSALYLIMGWTDTLMLGIFKTNSDVGVYRIALRLAIFTSFTLTAINSIAGPKFTELFWTKQIKKLKKVTKFSSSIIFWTSLPVFLVTIVFAKQILNVFGEQFVIGYMALIILSFGQLINASFGSVGLFLNMTNNQKVLRNAMIIGLFINVVLNFLLIPVYGIIGAAFATSLSSLIWNFLSSIKAYRIYGFWIGFSPFIEK